jgi:hypothetical protein
MQLHLAAGDQRVARPRWVWPAIVLEVGTGVLAIPVGLAFLVDPSGASVGLPRGWIEATPFGSYTLPGVYLLVMNGFGMLAVAGLSVMRHRLAPWLTGLLGVGLIIWIAVEILVMPETMVLTWVFLAVGFVMGVVALFWLRYTDQLRLW